MSPQPRTFATKPVPPMKANWGSSSAAQRGLPHGLPKPEPTNASRYAVRYPEVLWTHAEPHDSLRLTWERQMLSDVDFRHINANGTRLRVAVCGSGPPVIMGPRFSESWVSWGHQMR